MLCCVCKEKEAKVHLTQIVGDKMQKVDLCEGCAAQKGVNDPAGFSLFGVFWGAFGLVTGAANGLLQEATREVRHGRHSPPAAGDPHTRPMWVAAAVGLAAALAIPAIKHKHTVLSPDRVRETGYRSTVSRFPYSVSRPRA